MKIGFLSRKKSVIARENRMGYVFVLPWVIGFCLFFLYPLIYSLVLAFSDVTNVQNFTMKFNGLANFSDALFKDVEFLPKLMTVLLNAIIKTPIVVVFSLFIAILLNQSIRLKGVYRALFLLPVLIGAGMVLQTLQGNGATLAFSPGSMAAEDTVQTGMIDIGQIEMSERISNLLGDRIAAGVEVVLEQVSDSLWMSGIQIILFLGALQSVPDSYYEAAMCDGATAWEKFWKITLPMIMPSMLIVVVYTMISYFTSAENDVMTYVVDTSFKSLQLDYGSAMGWIYFLCIGVLLGVVFLVSKKVTFYMGDK